MICALTAAAGSYRLGTELAVFLSVGLVLFYALLIYLLAKHSLILKYTLAWMIGGLVLAVFLIFPDVVLKLSDLIGVSNPVNAVFLLFAGVTLMLLLSLTSIVSQLSNRSRSLVQTVALLERRVRELEKGEKEKDGGEGGGES